MRFLSVTLGAPTGSGRALKRFYGDGLGLTAVPAGGAGPAFRAGPTALAFRLASGGKPFYHYALRVPRNRFAAARDWLARQSELLPDPGSGETTFEFESWRAEACYAHDPCGNIVELIAHHELPEETPGRHPFSAAELLGVCELGAVGPDPVAMAEALAAVGIRLWDGSLAPGRIAFMGGRDGVLILSRPGRGWLPTGRPAEIHRVEVVVAGARARTVTLPGTPHRVSVAPEPAP